MSRALLKTRMRRAALAIGLIFAATIGAPAAMVAASVSSVSVSAQSATPVANGPKVTSDKPDYHPGEVVTLIGSGWKPGELVTMVMVVNPHTHNNVTLISVADAVGKFTNSSYVVQMSDRNVNFNVTALGDSGSSAETTFTDSDTTTVTITGNGTVKDNQGPTINCTETNGTQSGTCSTSYGGGTNVTLTATAASGYTFTSWTNTGSTTCTPSSNTCTFSAPSGSGHTTTVAALFTATVVAPTIAKSFSPTSIASGANSTLTLTITNPNASTTLTGVAVTDTLPTGMTGSGFATTCTSGSVSTSTSAKLVLTSGSIAGGGSCTATATVTDSTPGTATNTTGTVSSTNGGTGGTASANLTIYGAATKLVYGQQPTNTAAGASITPAITVDVEDSNGNLVASSTASVTIAIATNPGGGTLSGTTTVNAVAGVATFSGLSINKTGTSYTLSAASSGLTTATSSAFNITPGTATQLIFTTEPSAAANGGTAFAQQPIVTVEDAFNNVVTTNAASVTLAINTGSGTLTCTTNPVTAASGVATFSGCNLNLPGSYTLKATSTGLTTATSTTIVVSVGPAAKLAFVQQPTNTVDGSAITPAVTVQILDAGGNLTTSTATLAMAIGTNPSGGTLSGTTSVAAVSGVATFSTLSINKTGTAYTLVASSSGLTNATSAAFNITPGAPTQVVFTTQPSTPDTSGTAFTTQPKASIEDANGNVVTSGTGSTDSITLAIGTNPSSGTLTCTNTTVTAAAGVATWAGCKINLAGAGYTLTATDNTETLTVATSNAITINAGTAAQLVFTTEPSATATGGTPFAQQPVVTVEDANGNAVTTSTTSVALAITNGTGTSGATLACNTNPLTDTSGISSFSGCNINLAGTGYTLTATATGLTSAVSSAISVSIGSAAKLAFSQQPTNTADGSPITPAVTVSVEDAGGNVVTSSTASIGIAMGTNPGGSTLTGTTPVSAVNGVATFSNLSLNKVGTGYTLSATSTGLTTATSSTFNIIAATATQLVFSTEPSTSAAAGAAFATQPKVTVEDANGNPVTSSSASITLAITSGTGTTGAALVCTTNPVTAASGIATFAGCNINLVGTGYTLTATSGALTAGVSTAISITPGTATKLIFTTEPSAGATGGTAFTQQPVVSVEDANGNVVTTNNSASITLAINTGTGVLTCTTNPVVASSGVATFAGCSLTLAGSYTLKATATGLTAAISTTIVVSVGPEAKLAFTTQPSNTAAGSTITPSVAVSVEDAGGNVVGTSTDSITVAIGTNPGSSTLSGTTTVNAVNGVATFSTLSLNKVGTAYTLTATDSTTALTTATSSTFNITPGAGTQLVFTTQPGGGTGGVAWSQQPVVTVEDASGNTVTTGTNSTASITLAIGTNPGSGTLSCTANPKAAVAGVDTFAGCKITSAGTGYTLTATATGLTTATSAGFNVTTGLAAQLAFTQQPTSTVAAATITPAVTVQVEDAGGNPVTSTASIVMAIGTNPSGGALSGTTTVSAVAGVATFSTLSINKAGTGYTLAATSTGLTTGTSSTFNITAGTATQIAFTVQPTNAAQGFPISPAVVVSVEDAGGNVVATATDSITVALGANPGASTLSGTLTVSAVSGAATFSTLSLNNTGTGYTLTATDTTNGYPVVTSSTFNVTVPQVTYIQPFNSGHGWTYTQVSCAAGTLGSCASSASTTTDCATSPCVDASAFDFLGDTSQTGYFQSPTGTYTWQTLGVPANANVTSVEGGWYDDASGCSGSTTAGIQIFNSTNSTEITSPSVYAVINVSSDTGTTHALGSAAAVISGYLSSSTSITLRFNLNPAATSDFDTCTLYGDNFELLINYTAATASNGPKRRGQVIVGWNREPDGSLGKMWTLNKDLPDVPTGSR